MDDNKIKIGYLLNPDKIFHRTLDDDIVEQLEKAGAFVVKFDLDDIYFSIESEEISLYIKNEKIKIDGFISYGHMSKFHHAAYYLIVTTLEKMGITTLHSIEVERILNNKYLQSLCYSKHNIPIPKTNIGFGVPSYLKIGDTHFPDMSVIKRLDRYGGEGISLHYIAEDLVDVGAKYLWKDEHTIFQQYIEDSPGRSVRVLCLNNKSIAAAEYIDYSGSFKSNASFQEKFKLESLMTSSKLQEYYSLAENACDSIANLTIAGVDIIDSPKHGLIVLEVNGWPDLYDIAASTNVDAFSKLCSVFFEKVSYNKYKK